VIYGTRTTRVTIVINSIVVAALTSFSGAVFAQANSNLVTEQDGTTNPVQAGVTLNTTAPVDTPVVEKSGASVTVHSGNAYVDSSLAAPPSVVGQTSIGAQLASQEKPLKASDALAPVTKANTPKIYTKAIASGPVEMDLRQLWNELKINNPQLASLRESYMSAKATVPQIAAPAHPQV
jgi:hypothetical protein